MARKKVSQHVQRLKAVAREHGTPVFVIRRSVLQAQVERFRKALPRVEPCYAVKANPHPEVVKVMAACGVGFDVASLAEMDVVLKAGVAPDRIIFANTIKPVDSLRIAAKRGVDLMTFDSEYELDKIADHAPGARVVVRIKVPNIGSIVELSLKFGVDPADALPMLIKAHKLGLKPTGVSFHVGSQCTRVENYVESLEIASIIFRDARLKQLPLTLLDIGGGFPITQMEDEEDAFDKVTSVIGTEINRLFDQNLRIIAEPGRFFAGPAASLVMSVVGKGIRENKHWYYLDDGVYGGLSGILFDHVKYEFKAMRDGRTVLSTLAGPTCDSLDIIARGEQMPELEIGDCIYVDHAGAYSWASATTFNGLPLPKVVVVP